MVTFQCHVPPLIELVEFFLHIHDSVAELPIFFKGMYKRPYDHEQCNSILACSQIVLMRFQTLLKCVGALAQDKTVQACSEVGVHLELLSVLLQIHFPELECDLVACRWICGLCWVHECQVLQTIFQLSRVVLICETHMSNQLPHGSNILLGGTFPCVVEYVAVHCGLTTGEGGPPVAIVSAVIPVVTSAAPPASSLWVTTASSASVAWCAVPRRSVAPFLTTRATFRLHGCSIGGL